MKAAALTGLILKRILAVNTVNRSEGRYAGRNRTTYALTMKLDGCTVYERGGSTAVSDSMHLVMLDPNGRYSYTVRERGRCIMAEFEGEVEREPDGEEFLSFTLSESAAQEISRAFVSMAEAWEMKRPGYVYRCASLFYKIIERAVVYSDSNYMPGKKRDALAPAVEYMRLRYMDAELTNERLAAVAGMSTVYFRKLFTAAYGISPMRYLHSVRITKAKELLLGEADSVSSIARAVGFSSVYSFSRAFRSEVGVPPTKYKKTKG